MLARAAKADIEEVSGSCEDMLAHRAALWTFVDHEGVEPTNNHAERELHNLPELTDAFRARRDPPLENAA